MQVFVVFYGLNNSKIRYDFNELTEDQINHLFKLLFEVACEYRNNPSTVRNEICLDIVSLLLRWNNINNIVSVVVSEIGASGNDYMLLNILSMLPIEVNSRRVYYFQRQ